MTKTHKKLEQAITRALTEVCETVKFATGEHALKGFEWITHFVQYHDFPDSLLIVVVFGRSQERLNALNAGKDKTVYRLISEQLKAENIHLNAIEKQVRFDSEEACDKHHAGDWQARYRQTRH
ncbi:MAG: Fis family transcriptional regulator [Oleiphilus sp.]|nr:MAG: Fis family transcriptional regulator [Oleiphilus sp.]